MLQIIFASSFPSHHICYSLNRLMIVYFHLFSPHKDKLSRSRRNTILRTLTRLNNIPIDKQNQFWLKSKTVIVLKIQHYFCGIAFIQQFNKYTFYIKQLTLQPVSLSTFAMSKRSHSKTIVCILE